MLRNNADTPTDESGSRYTLKATLRRLRKDFRLTIISFFGLCTMLGILPFAVFRFARGEFLTGIGDCVLIAIIGGLVAYAWISGRTRLVGNVVAFVVMIGYVVLVTFTNVSVFWAFPVLSASFLLADRYLAVAVSGLTLVGIAMQPGQFSSVVELSSFVVNGALAAAFGLIFATRTEMQRRQLAAIASSDHLTGAGNRLALRTSLDRCVEQFRRRREPAGLALLDLDHFKTINDTYGHDAGDQVLIAVVRQIRACMREQDQLFRMGGEEFVLLLPATDEQGMLSALAKLHDYLRAHLHGPGGPVTVSIGAAALTAPDPQSWLTRADRALYRAKKAGRNRLEMDGTEVGGAPV
ncbi:diguanylate cyclase [Wenzhouxiangella sp. XN201]|uniref:GGDEF domain-containing protein n=1 Tax=Wenzhouxiangella sp. XN201 TaxID=2710755 RepID=UPI0013C81CD0|nr:GGDEF domain-containing protein [Wenzhouxiangella sp. XN201]NEZ04878.1 diguanylate cyclase [Wenzhouxiangella sp. XN201]